MKEKYCRQTTIISITTEILNKILAVKSESVSKRLFTMTKRNLFHECNMQELIMIVAL
jgi:hypothetical protein